MTKDEVKEGSTTRPFASLAEGIVKDKFWLWGHDAGAHDQEWGLPGPSRITPVEAAVYLGIPNLIMVRYTNRPSPPFDQYALPLKALKRVVWSIVGAGGRTDEREREQVLELAGRYRNFTGVMMDDFFGSEESAHEGEMPAMSPAQLRELRSRLSVGGRRLELWAVLYDHQLDGAVSKYVELLDNVSFWTWDSQKIKLLKENFERLESLAPQCGKVLGCYMWDYGKKTPLPIELMQQQCELGLEWLKTGRIAGMIFLASCICDLELETVEWTRKWIAEAGQ